MGDPTYAVGVLASGTGTVWMLDPHLVVLGLLIAAWALDKLFAVFERFERPSSEGVRDSSVPPVEAVDRGREVDRPTRGE